MRYVSTRGQSDPVSLETALRAGLASDGGLFVPVSLPLNSLSTPLPSLRTCRSRPVSF